MAPQRTVSALKWLVYKRRKGSVMNRLLILLGTHLFFSQALIIKVSSGSRVRYNCVYYGRLDSSDGSIPRSSQKSSSRNGPCHWSRPTSHNGRRTQPPVRPRHDERIPPLDAHRNRRRSPPRNNPRPRIQRLLHPQGVSTNEQRLVNPHGRVSIPQSSRIPTRTARGGYQ